MDQFFTLTWENITVEVDEHKSRKKLILDNRTVESRKLIAIMGSSGAGKTTFLGAISGRLKDKKGILRINDQIVPNDYVKNVSGYVLQDHIFTDTLSVEEHLRFLCGLQLSKSNRQEKEAIIEKLLREVNLNGERFIKSLSGGEKRKLAFASELIGNPVVLFCDEPTTGLDSYAAISVIEKLKKIAYDDNKIVLTTIHQPSSQIFDLFDDILLMNAGKLIFHGNKSEMAIFFASYNLHCPENFNPADYFMNCLRTRGKELIQKSDPSPQLTQSNSTIPRTPVKKKSGSNIFCQLRWLVWRSFIDLKRTYGEHMMTIAILLILALIMSFTYATVSVDGPKSLHNVQGLLFAMASEIIYPNMYRVINVFPHDITVFLKEKDLYSPYPYFLSKFLSLMPVCLLGSIVYSLIFFVVVPVFHGFLFWFEMTYIMFLLSLMACSFGAGLAFSALLSSVMYVDLIFGTTEFFLVLFSGFWIKLESLSNLLTWIKYVSPFFYAYETLATLFWTDLEQNIIDNCAGNNSISCIQTEGEILEYVGIPLGYEIIVFDVICVHGLIALCCLLGFAGILRKRMIYSVY